MSLCWAGNGEKRHYRALDSDSPKPPRTSYHRGGGRYFGKGELTIIKGWAQWWGTYAKWQPGRSSTTAAKRINTLKFWVCEHHSDNTGPQIISLGGMGIKAKPAGRQHASYTTLSLPRNVSDYMRVFWYFHVVRGVPCRAYLMDKVSDHQEHCDPYLTLLISTWWLRAVWGRGLRGWQRGVGHLRIGPPGVVGENINGTVNLSMTNSEAISSAYALCHTNDNNSPSGERRSKAWCGAVAW